MTMPNAPGAKHYEATTVQKWWALLSRNTKIVIGASSAALIAVTLIIVFSVGGSGSGNGPYTPSSVSSGLPTTSAQMAAALVGTTNSYGVAVTSATCGTWFNGTSEGTPVGGTIGAPCEIHLADGSSLHVWGFVRNGTVRWSTN